MHRALTSSSAISLLHPRPSYLPWSRILTVSLHHRQKTQSLYVNSFGARNISSTTTRRNNDTTAASPVALLPAPSESSLLLNPTRISELSWFTPKFFPSNLMLVVGLTGGIATGKSSVSSLLKSHRVPVIDADIIAREVVLPGTPALRRIVSTFGPDILLPDGTLDRKKLGGIVFNDTSMRKKLNEIVHPAVRKKLFWSVMRCWWRGERMCVLDVPLLIEGGLWKLVGKVVVVYCSAEIQLQRLIKRDKSTHSEASSRLHSQIPISHKLQYADIIVDNSGSPQDLEIQVESLIRRLRKETGWSWRVSWLFPPWGLFSAVSTIMWNAVKRAREGKRVAERRANAAASTGVGRVVVEGS